MPENKCIICERPIPDGATHCSAKCLGESRLQDVVKIGAARNSFFGKMGDMLKMENEPAKTPEPTMVVVSHRWKRNKNEVVGSTVFAFNEIGEARVPFVGHVMVDVEALVLAGRGLVTYRVEAPSAPTPEPTPVPVETAPVLEPVTVPEEKAAEPEPVEIEPSPEPEPVVEEAKVEEPVVRRPVKPKRKP